ncbi:MAG: hypothetical protein WAS36_04280 [Candidatus Saccharimonadales bacterium]
MTPPLSALTHFADAIRPDNGIKSLVLAEVHIDASTIEPTKSAPRLAVATGLLKEVVDHTQYLLNRGFERSADISSEIAVAAGLRLIDVKNYDSWINGGVTTSNYPEIVASVSQIADSHMSAGAEDKLREYFPILLASRMLYRENRNERQPAAGRMALTREDWRPICAPGQNPRWDCALFSRDEDHDFTRPTNKVQVKVGEKREVTKFAQAGVKCISLRQLGLADTFDVLDRCYDEVGLPIIYEGEPVSSRELDFRTNRLLTELDLA